MSVTFEEAKAYLQNTKLYDHLSEVLLKILTEKPANSQDLFEHISNVVKQKTINPAEDGRQPVQDQATVTAKLSETNWAAAASKLFEGPAEGEEVSANFPAQDLVDEASMFEWAGIGFGREETFRLSLSLTKLAQKTNAQGLRFWGKILGRDGDYYIAEALAEEPQGEVDIQLQEGLEGANKYRYWALPTISPLENGVFTWRELPPVTVAQIDAARKLKRFFTGNLEAKVYGHPPFPGTEKNLLRAQVARISGSCVICPAGLYAVNEDGETTETPPEEVPSRSAEELLDLSHWVHKYREINSKGRCIPVPKTDEGEEGEVPAATEAEPPVIPPFRPLVDDGEGSWLSCMQPRNVNSNPANRVTVLRSVVWPGACTVGYGKRYVNVYVGYGTKFSEANYTPPNPLPIQKEFDQELPECVDVLTDPNPPAEAPAES